MMQVDGRPMNLASERVTETFLSVAQQDGGSGQSSHSGDEDASLRYEQQAASKKRRKQSNPVRYQTAPAAPAPEEEEEEEEEALNLETKKSGGDHRCPHCSGLFESEQHLRRHVEEEHVQKILEKQLSYTRSTSFDGRESPKDYSKPPFQIPTSLVPLLPYSDHKQASGLHIPLGMFPGPMAPFLFPVIPQGQNPPISNGGGSGPAPSPGGGVRIFNPEAYCELCNKEFCNKYFLKTHKANKHGIYSVDTLVSSPFAGSFFPGSSPLPSSLLPPTSISSGTEVVVRPPSLINVESFCEICQKEFCNKYFLKKHRQKIHGVIDTSQDSLPSDLRSSPSPPQQPPLLPEKNFQEVPLPCEVCKPDLPNAISMQNHKQLSHAPPPSSEPPPVSLFSSSFNSIVSVSTMTTTVAPSSMGESRNTGSVITQNPGHESSVLSMVFTPEKLREMGVINADAFCELCCKEFCNKYFLKTHKQNKHGIGGDPSKSGGERPSDESNSSNRSFEEGLLEAHFPRFQEMEFGCLGGGIAEMNCEICNRPFSSIYLLKMHKFYTHNIPYIKEESKPGTPEPEKGSFKNEQYEDVANHDLQKLQSMIRELNASVSFESSARTPCNICHIEFENKYFLRAHMMNEHGVLPNEDGQSEQQHHHHQQQQQQQQLLLQQPVLVPIEPQFSSCSSNHDSETFCGLCQKDFCSKFFLKSHKQSEPIPLLKRPTSDDSPKARNGSDSDCKNNRNVLGRNYCNICNKELCNKYFMKTHMLKMHGINLDTQPNEVARSNAIGTIGTIGGVTCDICQKELCSKYFLKVHKQNTHGILEDPPPPSSLKDPLPPTSTPMLLGPLKDPLAPTLGSSPELLPGEVADGNNRYYSHYTEVCPLCERRFKSIKWLKSHMVNDHGDVLKESLAPLPADSAPEMCVVCGQSFGDKGALQFHLAKEHRTSSEELGLANSGMIKKAPDSPLMETTPLSNGCSVGSPKVTVKRSGPGGTRIYHCSYCIYSTRWLSNLYAHEKRHTGLNAEGEKRFVCRVCHRAYRYNHSLQRHLLSHRASGLRDLPPILSPQVTGQGARFQGSDGSSLKGPPMKLKRYRCSKCNKKFRTRELCLAHIHAAHRKGGSGQPKSVRPYRCRLCCFSTRSWNILKIHISKQHPEAVPPPDDDGPPSQLPMTYAMPQNPPSAGSFIMQPFLVAQPEGSTTDTFVPSLVYLPVCQKISQPMTVAFTLTPA